MLFRSVSQSRYRGWDCDVNDVSSSGTCTVHHSFVKEMMKTYCNELPSNVGSYKFEYVKGSLIATPLNGWPATTTLELSADDSSSCHTIEGRIVGKEGMNDDSIAVRILGHSDAKIAINISCYPNLVDVACDDEWHHYRDWETDRKSVV